MDFLTLLVPHVYSVPFYILWLGGIVYALLNRERHPRTSLFAGIAMGILLLTDLLSTVLSAYIQSQGLGSGLSAAELGTRLAILSFCTLPFSILGWFLLLVAIFGREPVAEREAVNDRVD